MAQAKKKGRDSEQKERSGEQGKTDAKELSRQRQAEFEKWVDLFYRHTGRRRPDAPREIANEDLALEIHSGRRPKRKEPG